MNFVLDTHTHTVASGHAYSTLGEMVEMAKEKGLELLCITDHAPKMLGACKEIYFQNFRVIPRVIDGLNLCLGSEVNILDTDGNIDLHDTTIDNLDFIIASLHTPCFPPSTIEDNTTALLNAIKNPRIGIIGHPDDSRYPIDYVEVVKAAKEHNVLLELNNSSLNPTGFRLNAKENDIIMLNLCKKYGTSISLGSDAHIKYDIANFDYAKEILEITDFPEELIINTSVEKFKDFISKNKIG